MPIRAATSTTSPQRNSVMAVRRCREAVERARSVTSTEYRPAAPPHSEAAAAGATQNTEYFGIETPSMGGTSRGMPMVPARFSISITRFSFDLLDEVLH